MSRSRLHRYRWQYSEPMDKPLSEENALELEAFRVALEKGNRTALVMALRLCLPSVGTSPEALELVPRWVLEAAVDQLASGEVGSKRHGRHARTWTQHQDDMADLLRAHHVLIARKQGYKGDQALDRVSKELQGTFAATTAENLKKALKRFRRRCREEPWRYASDSIEVPEFIDLGRDP